MSSVSLYRKFLLLDMLAKRIVALGGKVDDPAFSSDYWDATATFNSTEEKTYSFLYHASVRVSGVPNGEAVEAFAEKWLTAYPDTELVRHSGRIYLRGETYLGLRWMVATGTGVCERVQVGTRKVTKIDPDYLVGAPTVEVYEPVFETRCGDPLREMVGAL